MIYEIVFLFINLKVSETPFPLALPFNLQHKLALAHSLTGSFPAKEGYTQEGFSQKRPCLQDRLMAMNFGHLPNCNLFVTLNN